MWQRRSWDTGNWWGLLTECLHFLKFSIPLRIIKIFTWTVKKLQCGSNKMGTISVQENHYPQSPWAERYTQIARFMWPTWGQHGAHLGPVGLRWALCWPHKPHYQGSHCQSSLSFCPLYNMDAITPQAAVFHIPGSYMIHTIGHTTNIDSSSPGKNGCHFPDDIFKCIFLKEKVWILIKISPKFVPKGPIDNNPDNSSVPNRRQAIIWANAYLIHWRIGDTRPQWVNLLNVLMLGWDKLYTLCGTLS